MGVLFAIATTIVILGFLWFYVARPILEDYGLISAPDGVKTFQEGADLQEPAQSALGVEEPEPARSSAEPRTNHVEPRSSGSPNGDELALNGDELAAVARMIKHNATAARPSKSSTIQAGFGVSRGGSAAYVRASLIYDALFGQPEPAVETPIAGRRTHARFGSEVHN